MIEKSTARDEEFLTYFKKGRQELDKGNLQSAMLNLEKAYELSPDSEGVENLLGLIYFRLEDFPKAEEIYKKLVKLNPFVFTLRANLGLIYFKEQKYFDAVRELNEAVNLKPDYAKAHNYLGLVYTELGKYRNAREEFLRAGSRAMAKKVDEIISGNRKPETLKLEAQVEKIKVLPQKTPTTIPSGEMILDPELKMMLDDFVENQKSDEGLNKKSDVEHIRLNQGKEGIRAIPSQPKEQRSAPTPVELKQKKEFSTSFHLGLNEGEPGATAVNLLNIRFSGYTYGRVKGLIAAEGNLDFEPVKKNIKGKPSEKDLGSGNDPIMKIIGDGRVLLSPEELKLKIFTLTKNEIMYLKESSLLAFQSGISWENGTIDFIDNENLDLVQLKGQGDIAITFKKHPVIKNISDQSPFKVSSNAIIGWQGKVVPKIVHISQKKDSGADIKIPFIEFTGNGKVIIE